MADQEPQETSKETNGRAPQPAPGVGEAAQLPERIRVHALAKLLGTTSKRILAHLTDMGSEARSAQSSLDRTVAESVREAFVPADETPGDQPQAGTVPVEAAQAESKQADTPADPEPEAALAVPEGVTLSAATDATEPAPPPRRQSLFTSPFRAHQAKAPEPVTFEAAQGPVAAPLFLPPDAAAAEEARRRRRAARQTKAEEQAEEEAAEQTAKNQAAADRTAKKRTAKDAVAQDRSARGEAAGPAETAAEVADESDTDAGDWDDDQSRDDTDDTDDDGGRSRRRRRGRRGRGRGRGEQSADGEGDESDEEDGDESAESAEDSADTDAESEAADDSESVPEGSTRRRRRRRRRKTGEEGAESESESSEDDPPNTVVHEREPRNKRRAAAASVDEVQGISGSTRLEAKRQRRRDGREAGRRRPPILTESEFLARRESVDRVMVVREKVFAGAGMAGDHPEAVTQVAVLEDNILVEHFVTTTGSASMVGNVYLGKVQNVLPSMEAAFVDIGRGRNGVLYAGEVNWEAAGLGGKERKIEQALRPGDTVLVQVSKDPVGHKGARLTTQISLAGRFLVYVPGGTSTGISRKLPDTERKRLKEILRDIVPQDAGVIIRTASEGVAEAELARDVERLQAAWKTIEEQAKNGSGAPKTLYEEPDLLVKVIRDLFNEDFSKLVIEGERSWTTVENYIRTVAPDLLVRVEKYDNSGSVDVFGSYRIDEQLAKGLDRKVWLPSGGTLVIDRTEAMTVIDVNTGKFTGAGGSNLEETVTRNNLEAAEEIVRQMRLRDIGGMIVVDFIDMVLESNRDLVLRRLTEALGRDRTRHQVSEVTSLGLVQMTRKKLGTGLVEAFSTTCEHCHGRGILVHDYPVESAPAEEGAGRREGRRRRKDKDKPDKPIPAALPVASPTPAEVHAAEEEAAARRAHPVALAMAAHHGEDGEHHDAEGHEAEGEPETVEAAHVPARRRRARSGRESGREQIAAESASVARNQEPIRDHRSRGESAVAQDDTADRAASVDAPAHAASAPAAADPVRRGRRRVARTTAAPSTDSAGAVFVLSSSEQAQTPAAAVTDFEPVMVPRSRPRRRGAGRAAGAPEEQND